MSYKKNLSRNVALCYVRQSRTMNKDDMTSPERQPVKNVKNTGGKLNFT